MKINKKAILIFSIASIILFSVNSALADFGISPPYVRNDKLIQGSHYEQKIILVRSDPTEDLKAEITIDVPGTEDWITIDKGLEFILPKGEKQMPIVVSVDVPKKAELGNYKGAIRVRTSSLKPPEEGTVAIALGGRIDVDLAVVEEEIFDFEVRSIKALDLDGGWKIEFLMTIKNTGNIESAPTKVHFDIYDIKKEELLESVDNINQLEKIKPFETKEIVAEFPTELEKGNYWAQFKIFKNEEVVRRGEVPVTILSKGANDLEKETSKKGFSYLYIGIGIVVLAGIGFALWRKRRMIKQ